MTVVSAYRLLADAEKQILAEKALTACRNWLADWCPTCPDFQLLPAEGKIVHQSASEWLLWRQDSTTWAAIRLPKGSERAFVQLLFGKTPVSVGGEQPSLLKELLCAVLADLLCRLGNLESPLPSPDISVVAMTEGQIRADSGAAVFVGKLAGNVPPLEIALGGAITARLLPTAAASQPAAPLAFRDKAISNGRVRLEVVLGEASFPLGELAGLAPGDVIALDVPIDHPVVLRVAGQAPVCHAHLGTRDDRKAIQLQRISPA